MGAINFILLWSLSQLQQFLSNHQIEARHWQSNFFNSINEIQLDSIVVFLKNYGQFTFLIKKIAFFLETNFTNGLFCTTTISFHYLLFQIKCLKGKEKWIFIYEVKLQYLRTWETIQVTDQETPVWGTGQRTPNVKY